MMPYLLAFCISAIPALFYWRRQNPVLWVIAGILLVLFVGLRHEVGGDWAGYLRITEQFASLSFFEALFTLEPAFSLLTWTSAKLGFGVYGVNLLGAAIFFWGLLSFCAIYKNRWLALAAATPFLAIVAVMSANRQGMAIGIILYAMSQWYRLGIVRRSLWIIFAGLFHVSALLLLVLTVADLRVSRIRKFIMFVVMGIAGVWLMSRSESSWTRYTTIYVEQSHGAYSPGAIFHLLLNLFPAAIMLIFRRRWSRMIEHWVLLRQLCILAFALLVFSPFMTVAAGRMSLYLFPISIAFIACLPQLVPPGSARALVRMACVMGLGAVLVTWLTFANTSFTYFPYQNVLTLHSSELDLP